MKHGMFPHSPSRSSSVSHHCCHPPSRLKVHRERWDWRTWEGRESHHAHMPRTNGVADSSAWAYRSPCPLFRPLYRPSQVDVCAMTPVVASSSPVAGVEYQQVFDSSNLINAGFRHQIRGLNRLDIRSNSNSTSKE